MNSLQMEIAESTNIINHRNDMVKYESMFLEIVKFKYNNHSIDIWDRNNDEVVTISAEDSCKIFGRIILTKDNSQFIEDECYTSNYVKIGEMFDKTIAYDFMDKCITELYENPNMKIYIYDVIIERFETSVDVCIKCFKQFDKE